MPAWILWLLLACLLVLPVIAVFIEDRPPRNEITDEQDPAEGRRRDGAELSAAA